MLTRVRHFMPATVACLIPNRWDWIAFPLLLGLLLLAATGIHETWVPLASLQTTPISLDPDKLPEYALRTTLRILTAMVAALIFTLIYGTLAAKSRHMERILVPLLDILQSVPVLGYISFSVTFFLGLFPGQVVGAECAAIFAIFTSQVWNMTFSFYQSLRTLPRDLLEVSRNLHLTPWQTFWKLEMPFAMPGLIWNMMMSMSGSWFFVVASEAITVGAQTITLPGIGAYLALALAKQSLAAVGWVVLVMCGVILLYDQLLFRPLVAWADKFRLENSVGGGAAKSWLLKLIQRTRVVQWGLQPIGRLLHAWACMRCAWLVMPRYDDRTVSRLGLTWEGLWLTLAGVGVYKAVFFMYSGVGLAEMLHVISLCAITLLRVVILIMLSSIIWVPIGVWVGLRPRWAEKVQPVAQFLAAFPANLLFPVFVIGIIQFDLNPDIWLSPLLILGTQWYILFNVIAGTTAFPNDFKEVAANFHIRGKQWWRQVMLPGVLPYYVTGAITASGGAWNASIVGEYVAWGSHQVAAHGLGAYIAANTAAGNYPQILLGVVMMSGCVVLFNRLLWRPLYALAENKLRLR